MYARYTRPLRETCLNIKLVLKSPIFVRLFQQSMSRPIHLCIIDDVHVAALGDDAKADGSVISIINIIHNIVIVNQVGLILRSEFSIINSPPLKPPSLVFHKYCTYAMLT